MSIDVKKVDLFCVYCKKLNPSLVVRKLILVRCVIINLH